MSAFHPICGHPDQIINAPKADWQIFALLAESGISANDPISDIRARQPTR